jgi:hypothetical protein
MKQEETVQTFLEHNLATSPKYAKNKGKPIFH